LESTLGLKKNIGHNAGLSSTDIFYDFVVYWIRERADRVIAMLLHDDQVIDKEGEE
tara:strand:+ start:331 stop:498 length:168 start_codon:yes stop_codon:yes gene_type:complete